MKHRTKLLIAGAAVAAVGVTAAVVLVAGPRDGGALTADSAGAVAADVPGAPLRIAAPAGTFRPNQRLAVGRPKTVPDIGRGRLLTAAVTLTAGGQPAHPLVVETRDAYDVDPGLTVGALWDEATGRVEALAVERLPDGRLRIRVPHLTVVGIVSYTSLDDLRGWLEGPVYEGVVHAVKDFFDAPFDCPVPTFATTLLDVVQYPASVRLQLDADDDPAITGAARLGFCNKLSLVYDYTAHGAARSDGLLLPRGTLTVALPLRGLAGDPFVVDAKYTGRAAVATALLAALQLLPNGGRIVKDVVSDGLLDADVLALLTNTARSCASSIDAALAQDDASLWDGAVSCWRNQHDFAQAVVDVFTKKAIDLGLESAASAKALPLMAILTGQSLNRIWAERYFFGRPEAVSFSYRLRCELRGIVGCPPRTGASGSPSPSGRPSGPASGQAAAVDVRGLVGRWSGPDNLMDIRADGTGTLSVPCAPPDLLPDPCTADLIHVAFRVTARTATVVTVKVTRTDSAQISGTVRFQRDAGPPQVLVLNEELGWYFCKEDDPRPPTFECS
ncbi:hypothetical protein AB0K00_25800 [Dactylosporangium sp. NPDC049525]|uniref:hypothetical protein n=1 Tax=Dactylosporangium sp. NPDC049525 TaxID=3154730 RepID=UPI00342410DE